MEAFLCTFLLLLPSAPAFFCLLLAGIPETQLQCKWVFQKLHGESSDLGYGCVVVVVVVVTFYYGWKNTPCQMSVSCSLVSCLTSGKKDIKVFWKNSKWNKGVPLIWKVPKAVLVELCYYLTIVVLIVRMSFIFQLTKPGENDQYLSIVIIS